MARSPITEPDSPPALLALGEILRLRSSATAPSDAASTVKLVLAACASVHLYTADRASEVARLEADKSENIRPALIWLHRQRDHPWERPLVGQVQLWVDSTGASAPAARAFRPAHGYWGDGVWRPPEGGFWTTSETDAAGSPWQHELAPRGGGRVWRLPTPQARIYEIRSAQDWRDLVCAYPRLVEPRPVSLTSELTLPAPLYIADLAQMSNDWDALRITMSGKLRAYFVPIPVRDGYTILHGEEGSEETLWLRWLFDPPDQEEPA